ncbi:hypothetical protein [Allofournierella sp.]|uniref:hypothetical protein n=1 Tax=Allofournierella sp. TaxID=1940256 RepID=UPI003AF04B50
MATYKGPDGRLYRVSEAPGIRGTYRIEYLDPACSVVYKQLPGYNDNANREEVVALLDKLAKDRGLVQAVVEDSPIPAWAVDIAKEFVASKWVRELESFSAACLQASSEAESHAGGTCGPGFADASPKGIRLWRPGAGEITYTWAKFVQACKAMGIGPAPNKAPAQKSKEKTMRKRNDRCPLQAECGRTCKVEGHERDCDYYVNNRVSCGGIPDQDALLDAEERERERAWEAAQIAEEAEPATEPADPCATCLCNTCADDNCDNAPGCYKDKDACVQTHNTAKCDDYRPKGAPEPATAEPQEIVDESSDQDTPAATLTAAPATEIAAPAFDFGADEPTNAILLQCAQTFVAGRLAQVMAAKRAHDLTADHYQGSWGKWCVAIGISRDTGDNLVRVAENFGNVELNGKSLVEIAPISLLSMASKPSAHPALKQGVGDGSITSLKEYKELEAKLKAAEAAKRLAETRAVVHEQKAAALEGTAKKAQEAVEDLIQKLYRRNEELSAKDQELSAALDQQGVYIAKLRELEKAPKDVAVEQPSEADIERWRREGEERARAEMARPRQTPLSANNVRPMACDLANSVTALYNTFLLAACELHGDEYAQCAAPLIAVLQDALTGLQGAVNEHNATTYKEDEDFE